MKSPTRTFTAPRPTPDSFADSLHPTRVGLMLVALACCLHGPDAHAYLDPGTGSILLQGLLALLAALGAFFGTIRRTLRQWLSGSRKTAGDASTDSTRDP